MLPATGMDKLSYQRGDLILFDGLYACSSESCDQKVWGVAGRQVARLPCGHEAAVRLVRRRIDRWW